MDKCSTNFDCLLTISLRSNKLFTYFKTDAMKYFLILSIAVLYSCNPESDEKLVEENGSLQQELDSLKEELTKARDLNTEILAVAEGEDEGDGEAGNPTPVFKYDPSINGTDIMKHFVSQLYINFPHKIDKEPSETWTQDWTTWAYSWKRKSTPVIYYYRWKDGLMGLGIYQSDANLKEFAYSQKGIEAFFGGTLDRSTDGLVKLFNTYKGAAFQVITPKIYQQTNLAAYVNNLIEVHAYLEGNHEGGVEFFNKLKETEQSGTYINHMDFKVYKDIISPYIGQEFMNSYYNKHEYYHGKDLTWFYSFWYRRHIEGNTKTVIKILKEVRDHYHGLGVEVDDKEPEGC